VKTAITGVETLFAFCDQACDPGRKSIHKKIVEALPCSEVVTLSPAAPEVRELERAKP
jgi:hypothetical protein